MADKFEAGPHNQGFKLEPGPNNQGSKLEPGPNNQDSKVQLPAGLEKSVLSLEQRLKVWKGTGEDFHEMEINIPLGHY